MNYGPLIAGTLVLLVAKFAAYRWYFSLLSRRLRASGNATRLALIRLAVGIAIGGLIWWIVPGSGRGDFLPAYFFAIGAGRVVAWAVSLVPVYSASQPWQSILAIPGGVLLSYAIDIPVALGLISAIGGIC